MIYTLSPLITLKTQTPTTNHCILSDIPSPGGAWGGRSSLVLAHSSFVRVPPSLCQILSLLLFNLRPFAF